jgi:hypothetical protein
MLRPSDANPYENSLIEKIREMTDTIVREDQIAKHPERFAGDPRAAAVLARAKLQAELEAKRHGAGLSYAAPLRKRV